MSRRLSNFDDFIRYVHGGKIRFSGCNARKQRAKFEELSADPERQQNLRVGWKRWESVKEHAMCHTVDGVIRRLYEFFQCFEGQCNTQQHLQELDSILDRRGADYEEKVSHVRRVLEGVSPESNNIVDDLVQDIERNSRPTIFWFLVKSPDADEQKITGAYKQFAFSKTTTKLVAPLFLWMWRTIERLVVDRLHLLQIVFEVVTCTYNQKTVTHLVPMKLLKDSKRVAKELKRIVALRNFVTDVSSLKFPEDIAQILSTEVGELRRQMEGRVVKNEGRMEDGDVDLMDEKETLPHDPYCARTAPVGRLPPQNFVGRFEYQNQNQYLDEQMVEDKLPWGEFPDLDESQAQQYVPFEYARHDFGNVPYMLERDERVEVMKKDDFVDDDPLPDEEEKQPLVTGVPVAVFGAPAPTEEGLDRNFDHNFFYTNTFTPPPPMAVPEPQARRMDFDGDDVDMTDGNLPPSVDRRSLSAIGSFGNFDGQPRQQFRLGASVWSNQFNLPPPPPPPRPQEDLSQRHVKMFGGDEQYGGAPNEGHGPPRREFDSLTDIPPPVVTDLDFDSFPHGFVGNFGQQWNDNASATAAPPFDRSKMTGMREEDGQNDFGTGMEHRPEFGLALVHPFPPMVEEEDEDGGTAGPFDGLGDGAVDGIGLPFGFGDSGGLVRNDYTLNGTASGCGMNGFSDPGTGFRRGVYNEPPGYGAQVITTSAIQYGFDGSFGFGNGFGGMVGHQSASGEYENNKMMDSGGMEVDFMNRPMEVDVPPPEVREAQFGGVEQNVSAFMLRNSDAINPSGGSRQNDPFDLDQNGNPTDYSRHGQTFF